MINEDIDKIDISGNKWIYIGGENSIWVLPKSNIEYIISTSNSHVRTIDLNKYDLSFTEKCLNVFGNTLYESTSEYVNLADIYDNNVRLVMAIIIYKSIIFKKISDLPF